MHDYRPQFCCIVTKDTIGLFHLDHHHIGSYLAIQGQESIDRSVIDTPTKRHASMSHHGQL